MALVVMHQAYSIQQLAYYKLWKSVNDHIAYDFSRNSRHGRLNGSFIAADIGLSTSDFYLVRFKSYRFVSQDEYTKSFWLLNFGEIILTMILATFKLSTF
jgi:hypothetical protein